MRGAEAPGRGLDQGDLIHATLRNFSPSHRLGGRLLCVWGGVLPVVFPSGSEPKRGSLVGRARGFLLASLRMRSHRLGGRLVVCAAARGAGAGRGAGCPGAR